MCSFHSHQGFIIMKWCWSVPKSSLSLRWSHAIYPWVRWWEVLPFADLHVKLPPEILRGSQLDHAEWWLLMCSQILFSTVFLGFSTNVHYRDGLLSFFSVIVTYIHLSLVSGRLNNTVLNDDWIIKEIMKKKLKFRNSRNKWKWKHIQNLPKNAGKVHHK